MNERALTEKQLAKIIGRTVKEVRSYVREGMTTNPDGTFDLVAVIAWKLQQEPLPECRGSVAGAEEYLLEILEDGGMPVTEIVKMGGYSERTLDRAKKSLGIVSKKDSVTGRWIWELPRANSAK
jgi:hypothetical protein